MTWPSTGLPYFKDKKSYRLERKCCVVKSDECRVSALIGIWLSLPNMRNMLQPIIEDQTIPYTHWMGRQLVFESDSSFLYELKTPEQWYHLFRINLCPLRHPMRQLIHSMTHSPSSVSNYLVDACYLFLYTTHGNISGYYPSIYYLWSISLKQSDVDHKEPQSFLYIELVFPQIMEVGFYYSRGLCVNLLSNLDHSPYYRPCHDVETKI